MSCLFVTCLGGGVQSSLHLSCLKSAVFLECCLLSFHTQRSQRERVLFIGTQCSNLYTSVDTPAKGRVGVTYTSASAQLHKDCRPRPTGLRSLHELQTEKHTKHPLTHIPRLSDQSHKLSHFSDKSPKLNLKGLGFRFFCVLIWLTCASSGVSELSKYVG